MSLLVTSCTMGKQPDRLLNKGPEYLRTRTNASLFGQHRKSAVELLAASKAQFYNSTVSPVPLDKQQDLAVSAGQHERYSKINNRKEKAPTRSKSEHILSQFVVLDDESDENNNDTSNDSINCVLDNTAWLNLRDGSSITTYDSEERKELESILSSSFNKEDTFNFVLPSVSLEIGKPANCCSQPELKLIDYCSSSDTIDEHEPIYKNITAQYHHLVVSNETNSPAIKRPVPLPRKSNIKPVPTPRKLSSRTSLNTTVKETNDCLRKVALFPCTHNPSPSNRVPYQETSQLKIQKLSTYSETDARVKHSVVESLTKQFTALSATSPPSESEKQCLFSKVENSPAHHFTPEVTGTFAATPVFIGKSDTCSYHAKRVFIIKDCVSGCLIPSSKQVLETSFVSSDSVHLNRCRKRCPDITASARAVKRERRSTGSDNSISKPDFVNSFVPLEKINSLSTHKSEMSIDRVDQTVCVSEISAIPAASMGAESMRGQDEWTREVTRSNSSLSGKMEPQDASSPLSLSPTPHFSLVPRSHSDIGCCLELQHSRDSSLMSNHSRLSRASVGADLENFFNQMGLEKEVLEPMNRLRELQVGEVFDSMSSLDSHDAISICSTYSRSEPEWNDAQSMDRSQQQTSIIERNARIIKWLCNVRKAKSQSQKPSNITSGKA